ncbi:hypothetical protein [Nocardia sp. NPDC020380]|uniref:hypothetical protein n=1 Tax=Nocardia sp. NPDC020380 TaxID=3364309 RepID=UPI00379A867A
MARQGRHGGSTHGTLRNQRPPVQATPRRPVRQVREVVFTPGWLAFELPTAVLLAIFVGTGWLGYAQHGGTPAQPRPAVVIPADQVARGH